MGRPLRFIPENHLVEVTLRTIHGRPLLAPTPAVTSAIAGVIARAQDLYRMKIHAIVAMSSHVHLLLSPGDAKQLAQFMCHVGGNIARRVGGLIGWKERFWGRRYRAIVVSNEDDAQIARLRYLIAHGPKENLVRDPRSWPGVHAARALCDGSMKIAGSWNAPRDLLAPPRPTKTWIHLTPLPCLREGSASAYKRFAKRLVTDIKHESSTGANFDSSSTRVRKLKRLPAPDFHAATIHARSVLRDAYRTFVRAYRRAARALRQGKWPVAFPRGCSPPCLPFRLSEA